MKSWPARLAVLLTSLAAVVGAAVAFALPAGAAALDYVALGDSYASGTGAPPYSDTACTRSNNSYPALWAAAHAPSTFAFVACGGATTDDVLSSQLTSLSAGTDLVTLQIGGNDVGFASTVLACGTLGSTTGCLRAIDQGLAKVRNELPAKLDRTYAAVKSRAPNARIVVVGYARLVEPTGTCLNATKRTALNNAADVLTGVLRQRAAAGGAEFLDATQAFTGHGACGTSPWLNDLSLLANGARAAHPNATGYRLGYLPLLNALTG
jgi:lysophospholipase L1-like esterase